VGFLLETAAELEAMNAELRTHDVCDDIRVSGIMRFTDESAVVLECKRVLNDVLQKLQQNMIARRKSHA
jgi:hypothetical protein